MQRSQRRLMLSNDSESLAPDVTLKVRRRRSRTSSAGGDFLDQESKESYSGSHAKVRNRRKANAKLVSRLRSKKKVKIPKNQKPPLKSLQRAIVLAPFHTLKKCFQTRLINLYSIEKMKKINQKLKMAKKPNTSFEYDVIEIKPSLKNKIKKEPKLAYAHQSVSSKDKMNNCEKSRSRSYCQCTKSKSKSIVNTGNSAQIETRMRKRRTRSHITKDPTSPEFIISSPFAGPGENKKRKIRGQGFTTNILKAELSIPPLLKSEENLLSAGRSDLSISVLSSPSKAESWETYTDSPLSKEEFLQGSLAISTTSFDSFLEQFERSRLKRTERLASKKPLKKSNDPTQKESTSVLLSPNDLLPRQRNSESRHLIMAGIKPSEEGIADFMDREPQAQVIASIETSQHLHPLRRQSKTKEKPQPEAETTRVSSVKFIEQSQEEEPITIVRSRNDSLHFSQSSLRSSKILRMSKISSEVSTNTEERFSQEQKDTPSILICESGTAENTKKNSKEKTPTTLEDSSSDQVCTDYEAGEPKAVSSNRLSPDENKENSPTKFTGETDKQESKDNENTNQYDDAFWVEDVEPSTLPEEQSEISSVDILPGLDGGSLISRDDCMESRPPQEKDSSFIFGERNSAARMGESCEFSFGVNWPLSDDEDSDHGHRFF